jgi:hypothetical protein
MQIMGVVDHIHNALYTRVNHFCSRKVHRFGLVNMYDQYQQVVSLTYLNQNRAGEKWRGSGWVAPHVHKNIV